MLRQAKRALVFRDPRQFGRVRFHHGQSEPPWWGGPPEISSPDFNAKYVAAFLKRHGRAPIKAIILRQDGFPASAIGWRTKFFGARRLRPRPLPVHSRRNSAWRSAARPDLLRANPSELLASDNSDPPATWLIHQRWKANGVCPRHGTPLERATIGGRTTAWCPRCQR